MSVTCSIVGLGNCVVDRASGDKMSGACGMSECSANSIRSPLRKPKFITSNLGDSEHTLAVVADDCQSKGSYKTARDKRVAELRKLLRPVEEVAKTL